MDFVVTILIGLAAGWLAGVAAKGKGFGWLGNLIVGALGALLGHFLFGVLGFTAVTIVGRLISATLGAIVLLALLHLATRAR